MTNSVKISKIELIKMIRHYTNASLFDSKILAEALEDSGLITVEVQGTHKVLYPNPRSPHSPNKVGQHNLSPQIKS